MTSITKLSFIVGILLIGLGVILYISTGSKSLTAMIPSCFGLPILLCGIIARNENKRKMAAHIAVLFGLLGALGGLGMGMKKIITNDLRAAAVGMVTMGLICLFYIITCIKSFIAPWKSS